MPTEWFAFDDVLAELQIDKDELKKLVSEGELRCFRDGMSMKFKRDDVLALKKGRETEPTIILTDSDQAMGAPDSGEELILDEGDVADTVVDLGALESDAVPEPVATDTQEDIELDVAEDAPVGDAEGADVSYTEDGAPADDSAETLVDVGAPQEMETESFELVDEDATAVADVAEIEETRPSARLQRSAKMRAMQLRQAPSQVVWTVILLIASLVLIFPGAIYMNAQRGVAPDWLVEFSQSFRGMVDSIYAMF